MAPEMSTQTIDPVYMRAAATSPPGTPTPSTHQQQQQQQGQGQFQPGYYQQYPAAYGQPFQPYPLAQGQSMSTQQPQYQQQYGQQETQNAKGWVFTKLALHALDIIICICGIGISFSIGNNNLSGPAFYICSVIYFAALIWDVAEFGTWFARNRQTGIHPGAHVAVSLLIWLGAAIIGGIESTFVAVTAYDYESNSQCYDSDRRVYVNCNNEDPYKDQRGKFLAVAVFTCLVWLIHFILFVGACVDTAKRNAAMRRVMVVAPPYWPQAVQGWQPMPQYYPPQQNMREPAQSQQQQQNIPLQTRSPAPTDENDKGKGKDVERGESSTQPTTAPAGSSVVEYYTPSQR
ncbi:hypothetical protein BGZ63DRAFT_407150 [Mariannaea sp. PMI_226]|nr:hypothetical protein BGZ63DRAFT_407150 [Mariannaea sp. PMI_226]